MEKKIERISKKDEASLEKGEALLLEKLKKARLENRNITRTPALTKKIEKYLERHGLDFTVDYVYDRIKEDPLVASIFEKEPLKQNFTEKFIFNMIKEKSGLKDEDAINYFSGTKNYLINGKLVDNNTSDTNMKTIDFKFVKNGINYYCTQKYTTTSGSNQDDRFAELLHFVESNSVEPSDKNIVAVAIVDGSYFKKRAAKYKSEFSCFKYLKERSGYCKVMTYLQFIDFLKKN